MRKHIKKLFKVSIFGIVMLLTTANVHAQEVNVNRIAGSNRIDTAIEISKEAGLDRSTAIISSTEGSVDALASTLLASKTGAVQLLTGPKTLDKNLRAHLKQLQIEKVYLIGGTSVLSKSIEVELSKSYDVKRLAGKDRVETSIQIIEELSNVSDPNKLSDTFFIVNGHQGLADALSIGPVAGRDSNPILLTDKDKIPTKTIELINKKKPKEIIIIGGSSVVSPKVEKELEKYSKVDRIAGKNRGATSVAIARRYYINPEGAILANGQTFADALSGGYYAIEQGKPLLLLTNNSTNKEVNEYVKENNTHLTFLGGTNSISKSTEKVITVSANKPADNPVDVPVDNDEPIDKPVDEPSNGKINTKEELVEAIHQHIINGVGKRQSDYESIEFNYYGKDGEDLSKETNLYDIMGPNQRLGGYLEGISSIQINENEVFNGTRIISVMISYKTTGNEEAFIESEAKRISNQIIQSNFSDYEKVKAIYDYIVNNFEYSQNTNGSHANPHTLLKEGEGACGAYSLTMSKLLDYNNIDNYYILGKGKGLNRTQWALHAWNKVKLDGKWYNLDVTWGFPDNGYGTDNPYYHFLVSDSRFNQTHKAHNPKLYPNSTDTKYERLYDGMYDDMQ